MAERVQMKIRMDTAFRARLDAQLKREGLDHYGGLNHLLLDMLEAELVRRERAHRRSKQRKGG